MMLEVTLRLNVKLRSAAREALFGRGGRELLEEILDTFKEIYSEIGIPERMKLIEDLLKSDPEIGLKAALSSLSEDIREFIYSKAVRRI